MKRNYDLVSEQKNRIKEDMLINDKLLQQKINNYDSNELKKKKDKALSEGNYISFGAISEFERNKDINTLFVIIEQLEKVVYDHMKELSKFKKERNNNESNHK